MEIGWKIRRARQLAQRVAGSLALRGWGGTLRRALAHRGPADELDAQAGPGTPAITPLPPVGSRRILVVDQKAPDPSRDAGSVRLCEIFRLLASAGWFVDFLSDDNDISAREIARLAAYGVRAHSGDPYRWLVREGNALDAVMLCRFPVAASYLSSVRRLSPGSRVIFDTVDLHYVRQRRAAEVTGNRRLARQALRSRRQELAIVRDSDATFVVSAEEKEILMREIPQARIECVTMIHEVAGFVAPFGARRGLLFVGGFGHPPNEDAVYWFVREVLPKVRATDQEIALHVVGDVHDAARHFLRAEGVIVHGRVDDLGPLYAEVRLSIAPLRFGAGVKGKVTQAMSHGLPVVLTTVAAEGMHLRDEVSALIADDPEAMADAIRRAYHDPVLWQQLSDAGLENVRRHFSPDQARAALVRGLQE